MTSPRTLEQRARSYGLTRAKYRQIRAIVTGQERLVPASKFEIAQEVHAAVLRESGQLVRDFEREMCT